MPRPEQVPQVFQPAFGLGTDNDLPVEKSVRGSGLQLSSDPGDTGWEPGHESMVRYGSNPISSLSGHGVLGRVKLPDIFDANFAFYLIRCHTAQ